MQEINVIHFISGHKDRNLPITSTDAENNFDKSQHPFMIRALMRLGIE